MTYTLSNNWRNDPGLHSVTEYKRKFAIRPITCSDNIQVWFKFYYKKYEHWGHSNIPFNRNFNTLDESYIHTDFIENISEAEYIVRKLSENL